MHVVELQPPVCGAVPRQGAGLPQPRGRGDGGPVSLLLFYFTVVVARVCPTAGQNREID